MVEMRCCNWVLVLALAVGCGKTPAAPPATPAVERPATKQVTPAQRLSDARKALRTSEYSAAASGFEALLGSELKPEATLGLAEVKLITGDYRGAIALAEPMATATSKHGKQAMLLQARALQSLGELSAAEVRLSPLIAEPDAHRAHLLLGEVLLEQGKRAAAEPVLMKLVEAYNSDRIKDTQGVLLALVGRAAHLLRAPRDANDAFNLAERAQSGELHIPTLLWRAELFLEKHDPGHAEEVVREVLAVAPEHPQALVRLAQVRLEQALDFDEAERLARQALEVNPKLTQAKMVLAGVALRDMELERASEQVDQGLEHRPRDLELLSMQAAVRFLADDRPGFDKAVQHVLSLNPGYSAVYQIVGEYAEWEHRYDEIVAMMEEAIRIDPGDAHAHAALGLNLIRAGEDDAGIVSLRTAFDLDPFNVRVFNTLNLYEKIIPEQYVSVDRGKFRIRYPKQERDLLDRYVPQLLDRAYAAMKKHYGFEPETPIGIELYAKREHFSVRTSGLPRTAIQGVCFGRTLASMSLGEEKFNLGMTLWHELAHVFHIMLSKYHVPRWFTEGLAEYETLIERPEWSREHDPDLYEALRSQRMPEVARMSRAFTRAEQISDVATAYYASSKILTMLVEQHGMNKMRDMLESWGQGVRTADVVEQVLGVDTATLDQQFRAHTGVALKRYEAQFVPNLRAEALDKLKAELKRAPNDAGVLLRAALSEWRAGDAEQAGKLLQKVMKLAPEAPNAVYLAGQLALERGKPAAAGERAEQLVRLGHNGYWTQLLFAEALLTDKKFGPAELALEAAHGFDTTQAEPLTQLYRLARQRSDEAAQIQVLQKLAMLEQHSGALYGRLFELLVAQGKFKEVVELGESALWADLSSFDIHFNLARALQKTGDAERARFELESATLCEAPQPRLVEAHLELTRALLQAGQRGRAREQAERLRQLDPQNADLTRLGL